MREIVKKLKDKGEINDFLFEKAVKSPYLSDSLIEDAKAMTAIGVSSDDDFKTFSYILMHGPPILQELAAKKLDKDELSSLSHFIFSSRKEKPIDTILNFYVAAESALRASRAPLKKIAYPQGQGGQLIMSPYDVNRWMAAMRQIYALKHKGLMGDHAFNIATKDWDIMEKRNFKHWMRFYEEGAHMKYKKAQVTDRYYASDSGVMIPIDHLKADMPSPPGMPNMNQFQKAEEDQEALIKEQLEQEKRENIKKRITQIESRLRAAETIIRKNPDVARELNKVLEMGLSNWLDLLTRVRLSLVKVPIINANSSILEDLIVREGMILKSNGYDNSGELLISLAQVKPPTVEEIKNKQPEGEAPPAEEGEEELPPMDDMPPLEEEDPTGGEEAVREFINKLNNETTKDAQEHPDIVVYSQEVAEEIPADIQVEEEDEKGLIGEDLEAAPDPFEGRDVKVEDIIARLEAVSDLLKNREIPRQLSIIDLELDKLNMAAFFPTLAEATRSALESNQYMSTRIEEVLSKLRGTVQSSNVQIDLAPDKSGEQPDALDELRKNLDDSKKDEAPPAPEEEVPAELQEPANVQKGTPTRIT